MNLKKKKNDPTKDENKKGLKNNKNPSQSKSLEKQVEDYFFCLLLSFYQSF
ncbi:hypothetical protein MMM127_06420 [Helicobacter pylori]